MKAFLKRILPAAASSRLGVVSGRIRAFYLQHFQRDYSQRGETVAVRRLLQGCPERTFVEIGANDGITVSVTYGLVLDGWSGLSVEANPGVYEKLQRNLASYPKVVPLCCAASATKGPVRLYLGKNDPAGLLSTTSTEDSPYFRAVRDDSSFVDVEGWPLTDILRQNHVASRFGLLVVDAEGMDLEILGALDFSAYRPRLIVTEDYAPKDEQKFTLLQGAGYTLRQHVGCNTFWTDTKVA